MNIPNFTTITTHSNLKTGDNRLSLGFVMTEELDTCDRTLFLFCPYCKTWSKQTIKLLDLMNDYTLAAKTAQNLRDAHVTAFHNQEEMHNYD